MTFGEGRWVPLLQIDSALAELWADMQQSGQGTASAVVHELTMVSVVSGARQAERVTEVLDELGAGTAVRGIVLVEQSPGDEVQVPEARGPQRYPGALVQVRCHRSAHSPGQAACREHVLLAAQTEDAPFLREILAPLLLPGLPVVLWMPQEPSCKRQGLKRLAAMADYFVLDSAAFADTARGLRLLADLVTKMKGRPVILDLSWERLRPWRELVAGLFDDPERLALLDRIQALTVTYGRETVAPDLSARGKGSLGPAGARVLLFCGWLMSRLGWAVEDEGRRQEGDAVVIALSRGHGGRPTKVFLRLRPHLCHPGVHADLETVTLEAGGLDDEVGQEVIALRRSAETGLCSAAVRYGDREIEVHTVDMSTQSETALLARLVAELRRDKEFESALAAAVTLVDSFGIGWSRA